MATLPPNSLLARSRQTRSGPIAKSSAAPIAPSIASNPVSTTHLSLFLTNLRLLDLPSYPDWPGLDAQTFSVQKKRIHCVEWTLYQLFVLWDPEEARNKLQPFFPPRDHVQSLNLRAALLRSLDQAKKNGVLGRDAVIRKTMLDECKGERLEEVLAVFSSVVLKKIVAQVSEAEGEYPAVAQQLALEDRGYNTERTELIPLALAHRASIANAMRRKNDARKQYSGLAELLNLKDVAITRRREEIKAASELSKGRDVPDDVKFDTWRMVRNNWAGNEQWMETLLYGDSNARKDGLLSVSFDRVWRSLQSGRLSELEDHGKGLLEQLDDRVRTQRERLAQWRHFQAKMFGNRPNLTTNPAPQPKRIKRGVNLAFDLHENLHLGQMSWRKQLAKKSPSLTRDYASLLADCEAELAQVGSAPLIDLSKVLGPRTRQPEKPDINACARESLGEETVSELSELEDDIQGLNTGLRRLSPHDDASQPGSPPCRPALTLSHETRRPIGIKPSSLSPPLLPPDSHTELSIPPPTPPLPEEEGVTEKPPSRLPSPSPPERERKGFSVTFEGEDSSPEPPKSPTQELADKILNDMDNASPSPIKRPKPRHTLSLAERTRLSMVRSSRGIRYDPDDEEEDDALSLQPSLASINRQMKDITINVTDEDDLVSRTRRSMAGFEASRQKAQLDRQRSLKKSRAQPKTVPVVEEETLQLDPDASILAEELMTVEDMEAVFRSRPRIKTSPAPSPSRKSLQDSL
ncbi:hypothetical protein CGRA01v4_08107 [Colletotrichum graminicola]|uniref:HAUS augmin-like complex subunit 6 N-terminal domain-containing protein n=1 Tax=Colletotrichum graminicola (strain M1.001 / M2 / FGSC 10212) TaxID=645133 RepID=E3QZC0_COLGM|nr:uncharacterized protein GLRG_11353 [Colletotrichum graminicola M1.001]EFQ36208.1 hypothetical protein GLRG_11353 [Colletotrichum graminicola M1.001]WDK16824.1 hypothetical protein CGRA01v4_08107 [Colletotrichum graminicola]